LIIEDGVGNGLILPFGPAAPVTEPEPGLKREVLVHSAVMMLVRHQMRKGWRGAAHRHPHEQLVYVISGRIHVRIGNAGTKPLRAITSLWRPTRSTRPRLPKTAWCSMCLHLLVRTTCNAAKMVMKRTLFILIAGLIAARDRLLEHQWRQQGFI
jgi:hypothetical protein